MPKLQETKYKTGNSAFSVYIPNEHIEKLNWKKGDRLVIQVNLLCSASQLIILRERDITNSGGTE